MSVEWVDPISTPAVGGATPVGGATLHAVTADLSDSTYIELEGAAATIAFDPPSGSNIVGAQVSVRSNKGSGLASRVNVTTNGADPFTASFVVNWGIINTSFFPSLESSSGVPVDAFDVADPQISIANMTAFTLPLIYALRLGFISVDPSTVAVDAPTGTLTDTNLPVVEWTATLDSDGGEQASYEVKLFDSLTYGGFGSLDPDTDTPFETSGEVAGRDSSWQGSTILPIDDYRAYVRVAQAVGEDVIWSDWDYNDFSVDVQTPGTPDLDAVARDSEGRIDLTISPLNALATAGNVLTPGGGRFTNNITGWSGSAGATLSHNTTEGYGSSVGSLQIVTAGSNGNEDAVSSNVTVLPGHTFLFNARLKGPVGAEVRVRLNELDVSSVELDHTSTSLVCDGTWQKIAVTHTVGLGVKLQIKMGTDTLAQAITLLADLVNLTDAANAASNPGFESDLAGWNDSGTGTIDITRVTTEHKRGGASMEVSVDGSAGNQGARSDSFALAASQTNTARVYVKAPSGASLRAQLQGRTSGDATVGTTTVGFTGTGAWELIEVERAFGATEVLARVYVITTGTPLAVTFYVDEVYVTEGPAAPTDAFQIQRSDDGGVTWDYIRTVADDSRIDLGSFPRDHEAVNGGRVRYRARSLRNGPTDATLTIYSDWVEGEDVIWTSASAWLKHPYLPWLNMPVTVQSLPTRRRAARVTEFQPLGRNCVVAVYDKRGPAEGDLSLRVFTEETQYDLDNLLNELAPLLLQLPSGWHWPDRWLVLKDHERTRIIDKFDIEQTFDTVPWTAVPSPEGTLVAFSESDSEET